MIGVLVFPDFQLLDAAGPISVFEIGARLAENAPAIRVVAVTPGPVRSSSGVEMMARALKPSGAITTLIIAGGAGVQQAATCEKTLGFVRALAKRGVRVASVCSGAYILAEAGVLDGRRATTHPSYVDHLRARFPAAHVTDQGIFVRDGGVWTSAGIAPAIDLTLALVDDHHGPAVAMAVAKRLMLYLRRSGNQPQQSPALRRQEREPPKLFDITRFVLDHLDEALSVERIATGVGMSPRTLTRRCREHLNESPAELVRRIRLDEARRLLQETALPLKDISARAGLGDASTLWRAFTRRLGVTPAGYRRRVAMPS